MKSSNLAHIVVSALAAAFVMTATAVKADEYIHIGELKFDGPADIVQVAAPKAAPIIIETSANIAIPREALEQVDDPIVYTKSLQSRVEAFRRAMVEADIEVLDALADEDLSFGHSNGNIQTKRQFIDMVRNGDEVFLKLDLSEKEVKQSGNLSIERHIFTSDIVIGGETISVRLNILEVWRNGQGGWRLIARQAYKV